MPRPGGRARYTTWLINGSRRSCLIAARLVIFTTVAVASRRRTRRGRRKAGSRTRARKEQHLESRKRRVWFEAGKTLQETNIFLGGAVRPFCTILWSYDTVAMGGCHLHRYVD